MVFSSSMARLVISPSTAKSIIYLCEERPDQEGRNVGHTMRQHINISRLGLMTRMDAGPGRHDQKEVFWRSAFLSVDSAAQVLSQAIDLSTHRFVTDFSNQAEGAYLVDDVQMPSFDCRDQRGSCNAAQVHIYARKMAERPWGFHLITFFPVIALA